jgi:diguanylate cyclase (GGDEF)-like protein
MKKKTIGIIALVLVLLFGGYYAYHHYAEQDSNTTLTMAEKEWVQNNKKDLQDMSIITSIPVLNYDGNGVILDFISDLEKDTNLTFNKIPYTAGKELKSKYAFTVKDNVDSNDILVYKDEYVLVSKNSAKYDAPSDIDDASIGILTGDLDKVSNVLKSASNVTFKEYSDINTLATALSNGAVSMIAIPRLQYLYNIVSNDGFNIVYHISELEQNYVLTLGDVNELNVILKKYYANWAGKNFTDKFNSYLVSDYFTFAKVSNKDQSTLKSKTYTYGYVSSYPYDVGGNNLSGINVDLLHSLKEIAGIKIECKQFSSLGSMYDSLNSNNIDFYYDKTQFKDYNLDVYKTIVPYTNEMLIVSELSNTKVINSLSSLTGINVLAIKDSKINQYLKDNGITTTEYNNIDDLVKNAKSDSVLAIDSMNYDYYLHNGLENTHVVVRMTLSDGYRFVVRNISANTVFENFLNFYLSFVNEKEYINNSYSELLTVKSKTNILINMLTFIGAIIVGMFVIYLVYRAIRNRIKNLTKDDKNNKLRYIDMLTSLKNRNYLNEHIDTWDTDEVYPKAIVVVDLNNVAYINDNYGHQEGDNVIKEAASILIKTQVDNSDLIRTSGNEFLIYLIGHDEKDVVNYTKKLNKEMKAIAHGFGAAVGYSMVPDAIKTIDDAINEATINMRENKNNATNNE